MIHRQTIAPTTLEQRRGNGRLSFNWYRIAITVPNSSIAASPMSLMIFSSWRIDSSLSSRPEIVIRIAKKTRL